MIEYSQIIAKVVKILKTNKELNEKENISNLLEYFIECEQLPRIDLYA